VMAVIFPFSARAGISDCTVLSAQLLGPEQEQVIAVAPGTFDIGDFVGGDRFFQIIFRCKTDATQYKWSLYQNGLSSIYPASIPNVNWANESHASVFTTMQLESLGLGVIGYYYSASYAGHFDLAPGQFFSNDYNELLMVFDPPLPIAIEDNVYFYPRVNFRYRFVKINNNLDAILNTAVTTSYPTAIPIATFGVIDDQGYISPTGAATVHIPTLHIQQRACTPFIKDVSLPSVDAAELPSVGSKGATSDFNFTVRCPHNAARFGYYVESQYGYENEPNGVIKIDPASTAKGIGLQVTTRMIAKPIADNLAIAPSYQPFKFGSTNIYGNTSYVAITNGNPLTNETDYTFPGVFSNTPQLKVAVYRTGNLVPGSYTAALKVYIVYR